jgi:hypothetical protein
MFVQDGLGHADIGQLDTPFVVVERSGPVVRTWKTPVRSILVGSQCRRVDFSLTGR